VTCDLRYILPVLWTKSCFHIMEPSGYNQRQRYVWPSSPDGGIGAKLLFTIVGVSLKFDLGSETCIQEATRNSEKDIYSHHHVYERLRQSSGYRVFSGVYVFVCCLSVCLSVCFFTRYLKSRCS